jgi:hypothetical protein
LSAISVPLLHRLKKAADPNKLLLKQYGLTKRQRVEMVVWGLVLMQFARPVGSSIYFIGTQTRLAWNYPKQSTTLFNVYLGDLWDRLPNHVQALFHAHWFTHSHAAPAWWVTARHDFRDVLIGFLVVMLLGAIKVGMKDYKKATVGHMVKSVVLAFVAAIIVAAGLIVFFNWATPFMRHFGVSSGNAYVADWIGKGAPQLIVTGFIAGYVAKRILARTFYTIQLISLERKMSRGATEQWWWKLAYPPNYRRRYAYLVASGHKPQQHGKALGYTLSVCAPLYLFLLGFGIWLLYFGPASHIKG